MSKTLFNSFKNLHTSQQTLLLTNIWDAASAAIIENQGAQALATSSASVAWSNGYADGGQLPRSVLIDSIQKIMRVINIPLTVDIEDGYSQSPQEVADLVVQLVEMGVVGINIEDGLDSPKLLTDKIFAIKKSVANDAIFINARTDVYLQALVDDEFRLIETITRAKQYLASGADGIFVPGLNDSKEVSMLSQSIQAPLNIMIDTKQDNFAELIEAGAIRISMGPSTFTSAYQTLLNYDQNYSKSDTRTGFTYEALNGLF